MSYRPITPIKGPGIAAVSELYDEQQDARASQVVEETRRRAVDPTRGRRMAMLAGGLVVAAVLVGGLASSAWPRSAPSSTPAAVTSLATLAGSAASTTTFDGRQYTVAFTAADPASILAAARTYADQHGYTFDTPSDGRIAFDLAGPHGGVALGYDDGAGEPNSPVRIVVAASDLTADGSALR